MIKDYENWHKYKSHLDSRDNPPSINEREVWWCSIGSNIGSEVEGKSKFFNRPVLILRKYNKALFLGVPLTTKIKENRFYIKIDFLGKQQCALISQIRVYDSKRLTHLMGHLPSDEYNKIKKSIRDML